MVKESVTKALADANIKYNDIEQAVCGYVYGMQNIFGSFEIGIYCTIGIGYDVR